MCYIEKLKALCEQKGIICCLNEPMSEHTSFKIGGPAALFVKPSCVEDIKTVAGFAKQNDIKYRIVGKGSNLLVSDKGYDGIIINLGEEFKEIKLIDENTIYASSGVSLAELCRFACDNSLSGLEFAFGIPGSVGGAIYMNAGAYGGEIKDVISKAYHIDLDMSEGFFEKDKLELSYRHSAYTDNKFCITGGEFTLNKGVQSEIKEKMDDFMSRRKSKQPLNYPSAGSTFKRPVGNYASALIEQCGLKGKSVGGAMVSTKHSGFVVNTGNATCSDVLELVEEVKKEVFDKTGYKLECEVEIL